MRRLKHFRLRCCLFLAVAALVLFVTGLPAETAPAEPVSAETAEAPAAAHQPTAAPAKPEVVPEVPPVPLEQLAIGTNLPPPVLVVSTNADAEFTPPTQLDRFNYILATARFDASTRSYPTAEKNFVKLLADDVPEELRQTAMFELGLCVQAQGDLARAQAIFTQLLQKWPASVRAPEVYLHQGQIFRQMGLQNLALSKFYAVMTTALSLRSDQLAYYQRLVLQAQVEIAETHYLVGKYQEAADYYSRLLAQSNPALDRTQIQFRYIRSLEAINKHEEAAKQAMDFLTRFPDSPEQPEVRYHLAQALKGQNRMTEALQQVKIFLVEQRAKTKEHPEVWSYWQQRVGNEIGNELYREGDYVKALQVYLALAQLDDAMAWQLPVRYQIGITYEKLLQPGLAMEAYRNILTNSVAEPGTNLTPNLKSIMDMAGWRLNFLEWQRRSESFQAAATNGPAAGTNFNLSQK